ncbi:MAG: dCTP deaminase [Rickettsiales bacterium]|nr:dCTP deaminase [Rickettsiales bacterium]|tara:strand:+ start:8683 stop:9219 length:537 start_codon:yes stop_codon:yes gene_type:complete
MILSDKKIRELLANNSLIIDPIADNAIQPASIDCRLGSHFLVIDENLNDNGVLSFDKEIKYKDIHADSIILPPKSFILATTKEHIRIPNGFSAFVEGRSSIGRMGLFIQNAGWVDSGFEGNITLELYNANSLPIKLDAERRICQLVICQMDQPSEFPYNGKYQGQTLSVGSKVYLDTV